MASSSGVSYSYSSSPIVSSTKNISTVKTSGIDALIDEAFGDSNNQTIRTEVMQAINPGSIRITESSYGSGGSSGAYGADNAASYGSGSSGAYGAGISSSYGASQSIGSALAGISSANIGNAYSTGISSSSGAGSGGIVSSSYSTGIGSSSGGGIVSSSYSSGASFGAGDSNSYGTGISSYSANASSGGRNCQFLAQLPLEQYKLMEDPNPEIIRKKPSERLNYLQEISVRFLEPPQVKNPGPIVIKQLPNRQIAPAPPLVVRQAPPKPSNPPPLIIREAPPPAPSTTGDKVITVPGKIIPPPPRRVVIEKLPPIPAKPQAVLIEKWLPFKPMKRKVVFQPPEPDCLLPNPRNLVIQWEQPEVDIRREVKNLGTQQANPEDYVRRYGAELLRHEEFKSAAAKIGAPENVLSSASHQQLGLTELEGDVQYLKLVNLESAGLTEYREYLSRLGISGAAQITSTQGLITSEVMTNMLSRDEAERTVNNLDAGREKLSTDSDLRAYFNSLDTNRDGIVDFAEFKAGISSGNATSTGYSSGGIISSTEISSGAGISGGYSSGAGISGGYSSGGGISGGYSSGGIISSSISSGDAISGGYSSGGIISSGISSGDAISTGFSTGGIISSGEITSTGISSGDIGSGSTGMSYSSYSSSAQY